MLADRFFTAALTAAVYCGSPAFLPAQDFEGQVRTRSIHVEVDVLAERIGSRDPKKLFDVSIEGILGMPTVEVEETVHFVKGSRFRSQPAGVENGPYSIADLEAGIFRSVQPSEKLYVEWTAEDLEASMEEMMAGMPEVPERDEGDAEEASIRPLGVTRAINGVRCTGYEVRDGEQLTWAWVTGEYPEAMRALQRMMEGIERLSPGDEEDDSDELFLQYGLPMLTQEVTLYNGEAEGAYEIEETLAVEAGPVSDSLFEVPAGYRKMSMQDMMRGMRNQEPPPR